MSKVIRIALVMQGGSSWMGGTEYIKNIVFALASLPSEIRNTFEVFLICSQSSDKRLYLSIEPYLDGIFYRENVLKPFKLGNSISWHLLKDLFFIREKFDFIYPNVAHYLPIPKSYVSGGWLADFQYKRMPEFFSAKDIVKMNKYFDDIIKCSSTIVLSSKNAEADIIEFFPNASKKARVLSFKTFPLSTWFEDDSIEIQREYNLPDCFFIVSNQFWKHKNHLLVFEALRILQEQLIYPVIVFTGSLNDHRQPDYSNQVLELIHKFNLSRQVYLLGLIPRTSQMKLMRRSLAVIQPSLFEGWSTVVEDAICLGKPIILSDIPVHLEQNPPNAYFFDPSSAESLATHLRESWETLTPGPHLEQEAIAKENNRLNIEEFGLKFLDIVTDSLSSKRRCI